MAVPEFEVGDVVRLRVFVTVDGVGTDPTAPLCKVRDPDGNLTSVAAVADGTTGHWRSDFTTTKHGVHKYRFEGGGAGAGAGEDSFYVRHSRVL
jgi:hypothetical protein